MLDLKDPPKQLFAEGIWDPKIFADCVAIVGSRRMTKYGRAVIEQIVPQLVMAGKTIVSGFMYGVDQYAHEIALDNGGKTIAVLGWGIDCPLTEADAHLADRIIKGGGLMLSEWKDQKALLWTFPVRNRIVATLSSDVIVVEAAAKSGSLITARLAKQYQRRLWAIPGPVTSKTSEGTNQLIAAGDAKIWSVSRPESRGNPTNSTNPILELLSREPMTTSEIARELNIPVAATGAQLSLLLMENAVIEENGTYSLD